MSAKIKLNPFIEIYIEILITREEINVSSNT